jgi:beta-glucanase (GH16 family)
MRIGRLGRRPHPTREQVAMMILRIQASAAVTIAALFWACGTHQAAAQIPDVPGWEIAWHDEFDEPSVNVEDWNLLERRNSFNNEKQYYRPEQASIVDGKLRITATNEPLANKLYRSARIESRRAFAPGRFEARIDLPTSQGMWPAFWLLPNGVQWPTGGEIDILENRGSQPFIVSSAYHWQTSSGGQHQFVTEEYVANQGGSPVNFHDGFHVYAVEWEATQLRFYVDGTLHYTVNETANRPIFETPMNIILNLAVGGNFGGDPNATTVFPQVMDVDYVRVWRRPTGTPGDYNADGRVDATDYVVWRNSRGESGIGLPADGSGNGTIDDADYLVWRGNFAITSVTDVGSASALPEPSGMALAAIALVRVLIGRAAAMAGWPEGPQACSGGR